MPTNLPAGRIIAGFGGNLVVTTALGATSTLNVANWEVDRDWITTTVTHSGVVGGAIARRHVGYDWTAACTIWWDIDNPPNTLLQSDYSCAVTFNLGSLQGWQGYGYSQQGYFRAPSGLLRSMSIVDSSEGDDVVTANCVIEGNSRMFYLPNELADYSAYISQLIALGQYSGV